MPDKVIPIPTEVSPGFEFVHVSNFIHDVKPIVWLVHKLLEADSLALLFGDPESGKSLVALALGFCTSYGYPWHGRSVQNGAVFYIAGEGHNGLVRRIKALEIRHGLSIKDSNFYISRYSAALYNHESAVEICDAIDALSKHTGQQPILVIIDTLARNFGPANENSTEDMNQFISHVDKIREQFRATVLIVHHTGHGDKSRARGAYALTGAMDAEYRIDKDDDGTVRMTCTKAKDFDRSEPIAFKIRPVELGIEDEEGEPVTSVVLDAIDYIEPQKPVSKLGKRQRELMKLFDQLNAQHQQRLADSGLPTDTARVARSDLKDLAFETKSVRSRQSFSDGLRRLVDAGLLSDDGLYITRSDNTLRNTSSTL